MKGFLITLFLIAILLVIIVIAILYIKTTISNFLEKYFGTRDLKEAIEKSEIENENTPKSLSSMETLSLSSLKKDFPELNINEIKSMAENTITNYLRSISKKKIDDIKNYNDNIKNMVLAKIEDLGDNKVSYEDIKYHKTVINRYEKSKSIATLYMASALEYYKKDNKGRKKIQDRFTALTDGFTFTELNGLRMLCKNEKIHMKDLCDVVDLYKYGIKENPWKSLNIAELRNAQVQFESRVKGQNYAVTKTLDVIKRAVTGMSGLQGSSHTRPKGVLFFAGPTGTGKTETAKTLAEILFGDESCCIRFDMSEYGQSHSDQKLLGAPPGYVGYEAGGQLTNAVKKNPFSILLFDEIEKAHPSVLDKFLQILEDGRMTDGQGNTVYFSESIIIFTSNLGIYTLDEYGNRQSNVNSEMTYEEVKTKVRTAVEDYFKLQLGRPEILNRIGENIVVFDFIRPDVAKLILTSQIEKISASLALDKHIILSFSDKARNTLSAEALNNLSNGGRGIGNVVENLLINPLSRYLFDNEIFENAEIVIDEIDTVCNPPALKCTRRES